MAWCESSTWTGRKISYFNSELFILTVWGLTSSFLFSSSLIYDNGLELLGLEGGWMAQALKYPGKLSRHIMNQGASGTSVIELLCSQRLFEKRFFWKLNDTPVHAFSPLLPEWLMTHHTGLAWKGCGVERQFHLTTKTFFLWTTDADPGQQDPVLWQQ